MDEEDWRERERERERELEGCTKRKTAGRRGREIGVRKLLKGESWRKRELKEEGVGGFGGSS